MTGPVLAFRDGAPLPHYRALCQREARWAPWQTTLLVLSTGIGFWAGLGWLLAAALG